MTVAKKCFHDQDSQVNNYGLKCRGVSNVSGTRFVLGTCFINVALQCILSMEATRRAFMSLPHPDSPQYRIPRECMTALIHFFFIERQQPDIPYEDTVCPDGSIVVKIVGFLLRRSTNGIFDASKAGNPSSALHQILEMVAEEGYVTGLEEGLGGEYRTQIKCGTCGVDSHRFDKEIMLSFVTKKTWEFWENDRFFTIHDFFNFSERFSRFDFQQLCNCISVVYDLKCRTKIRRLPTALIIDLACVNCRENIIHEEIIDLSQHLESDHGANFKYQLIAAVERIGTRNHVIAYVRSSKFVNEYKSFNFERLWYRIDDKRVDLVRFSEVFKVKDYGLLIYEKIEPLEI